MWGKILTGAVIGVGAIAAAPFTGGGSLLGGATLMGSLAGAGVAATGAGLAGAAAGGAVARSAREKAEMEKENSRNEGRAEAKAEALIRIKQLELKLEEALQKLKSHNNHFRAIIALEAVGVACAACDGDFSQKEKDELGEFVNGMLGQSIPEDVKRIIKSIYDDPPTVKEAFILAKESGIALKLYEDLIQYVMTVDGIEHPKERAFVQAWDQLKAA